MAGTISLSLSQQLNSLGAPLNGGLLYFYAAGTTTPQLAYQDSALTIAHPWPMVCDSAGRLSQFFLADGSIKIRLTDSAGVVQIAADNILVVGPSSGEGGGGSVDATTIFDTGDIKARYGTGAHTGWVRANGRTIGSATSGATERANSDTQALFEYLWAADANLSVSSGRGSTANADWVANKTIALPDWRGRAIAGLDDMGSSAAGRLTSTYFGTAATALGAAGGAESHTLVTSEIPAHSHTGTTSENGDHSHPIGAQNSPSGTGATTFISGSNSATGSAGTHTHTFTSATTGGDGAHKNVQPTMLTTIYIKM